MPPRRPRPPLPLWLAEWGVAPEGWIAGVDEVGRGPLAGPVVAAAVVFPPGVTPPAVGDSKTLSATRRLRDWLDAESFQPANAASVFRFHSLWA